MTEETGAAGATTTIELTASEVETVVEALKLLLAALGRGDADQITEVQGLLARLPGTPG
jgi:hypothetical protein